jgi:molybdenum cofactor guanylyltransferase
MVHAGGVVLCGGHSTRMGAAKAWLPAGTETMLGRVVRIVSEAVGPVVVVAADGQQVPPLPAGVRVVRDTDRGPLGGLAAGLAALREECQVVYLSGCDAPLLRVGFVNRVIALGVASRLTVPFTDRRHPLAAAYPLAVLPLVLARLAAGELRISSLPDHFPTQFLSPDCFTDVDPQMESLRNVNTPEEYAATLNAL